MDAIRDAISTALSWFAVLFFGAAAMVVAYKFIIWSWKKVISFFPKKRKQEKSGKQEEAKAHVPSVLEQQDEVEAKERIGGMSRELVPYSDGELVPEQVQRAFRKRIERATKKRKYFIITACLLVALAIACAAIVPRYLSLSGRERVILTAIVLLAMFPAFLIQFSDDKGTHIKFPCPKCMKHFYVGTDEKWQCFWCHHEHKSGITIFGSRKEATIFEECCDCGEKPIGVQCPLCYEHIPFDDKAYRKEGSHAKPYRGIARYLKDRNKPAHDDKNNEFDPFGNV